MRINVARQNIITKILDRDTVRNFRSEQVDLRAMLKEILLWANKFVPSESGSVLLDDPALQGTEEKNDGRLYFVAVFGKCSTDLVNTSLPADTGIAGRTYLTGKPYISMKVKHDPRFYPGIDAKTKFKTKSIVCAPIKLKGRTIGVIELINRLNEINYSRTHLTMLKIFAEYTSTLIQNSLDAKTFEMLSMSDNLTGLYNDRYFYEKLATEASAAIKRGSDLSLIFLDLDRFKEVNDTHGHLAGSKVLVEVGNIIKDSLPTAGTRAARFGGDEFVIILPEMTLEKTTEYGEALRRSIQDHVFLKQPLYKDAKPINLSGLITSSIGVASLISNVKPAGTINAIRDALIRQSDTAMYMSKENGKNKCTSAVGKLDPQTMTARK